RPMAAIKILSGLRFRQAIQATEITAVSEAHPQIAQNEPMRIDEPAGVGHGLAAELVVARLLVFGAATLCHPAARTCAVRSEEGGLADWLPGFWVSCSAPR